MNIRAHVLISGRVQGVFFRSEIAQRAHMQSVKGWVRNLWDGRVEAVWEGEEEDVKRLVDFCRKGPPGARIKDASVTWEQPTGEFEDFEIG